MSRSFYLSLRFLPKEFRAPTSVGYLLARASDTIADAGQLGIRERRDLLARFVEFVTEGKIFQMPEVDGLPKGEKVLMSRLGDCVAALENLPNWQQVSVRKVVGIITEGQCWDLDRFAGEGVVSLDSDDELRRYTYQVAGCVGEFWTEIGIGGRGRFARASDDEMMRWGQAYGRSLQLINILRDVPEDQKNGRCYLPGAETREQLLRERHRWIKEAHKGLDQAERYARSLNGKRMRFGTVLPAMIGRKTLSRLEVASWDDWQARVKITRKEVYVLMAKAAKFAVS
ncbi:MAG: squalene/phytoene synthase family protein [Akkermansiaceae bacterium]|nr:squalene/phytoene synthase family protein [Akkermansiaceae bacterium]